MFGLKPAVPGLLGGFHIMRIGCRGLPQRDDGLPLLDTGRGVSVHVAGAPHRNRVFMRSVPGRPAPAFTVQVNGLRTWG